MSKNADVHSEKKSGAGAALAVGYCFLFQFSCCGPTARVTYWDC